MQNFVSQRLLFAALLLPLYCALLGLAGDVDGPETKARGFDPSDEKTCRESEAPFLPCVSLSSRCGLLKTTLQVKFAENQIGKDKVLLRSYNGQLVGPTLRVRRGDKLRIRLENCLPSVNVKDEMPGRLVPWTKKDPYLANITNLHTHGLHVSPCDPADNIFRPIKPGDHHDFCFEIHPRHPQGMFWYHPHWHGSVALQVGSGMAGALIVEGGLDDIPEIKTACERILVFQQIPPRGRNNMIETKPVVSAVDHDLAILPTGKAYTTINGQRQPIIQLRSGEIQRWRLLHAGLNDGLLRVKIIKPKDGGRANPPKLHEIAFDGIALGTMAPRDELKLAPGNRSDVLVQASEPGEFLLVDEKDEKTGRREYLARVSVSGKARHMCLPAKETLTKCAPFKPIEDKEIVNHLPPPAASAHSAAWAWASPHLTAAHVALALRVAHFAPFRIGLGKGDCFQIDGNTYSHAHHEVRFKVKVNSAEEWELTSDCNSHPFHIHVNHFQVISHVDSKGRPKLDDAHRVWRDTIMVDEGDKVLIRIRFKDFTGKTVFHCHTLNHEDRGMMAAFKIVPSDDCPAPGSSGGLKNQ